MSMPTVRTQGIGFRRAACRCCLAMYRSKSTSVTSHSFPKRSEAFLRFNERISSLWVGAAFSWTISCRSGRVFGPQRPALCVGIGVVDLKREPTLPPPRLLRRIAERSELTVVRDARTAEMLGGRDITVAPCPSLVAVPAAPPGPFGLLHVANMTTVGEQEFMQMRTTAEAWAGATSRVFRETNNRHHHDDAGLESVLDLYRRSDVVLSSALHGCLIAIAMGRPVVAVSGDYKIDEMMTDAGLADWLLGQEQIADVQSCLVDVLAHQAMPVAYVERALVEGRAVADRVRSLVDLKDRSEPPAAGVRRVNRRAQC